LFEDDGLICITTKKTKKVIIIVNNLY